MEEKKLIALKIKIEVVNELLKYLSVQPYSQVVALINEIQKAEPVFEKEEI